MRSTTRERLKTPLISAALALLIMNVPIQNVIPVPNLIAKILAPIPVGLLSLMTSLGFAGQDGDLGVGRWMILLVGIFAELFLLIWVLIYFIHDRRTS